jgi:hypothetical protein
MKNCLSAVLLTFLLAGVGAVAQVHGSGTTNTIPLWVSPHAIGNSVLFQKSGNVGSIGRSIRFGIPIGQFRVKNRFKWLS